MVEKSSSQVSQWISDQLSGVFPDWFKTMFLGQPKVVSLHFSKSVESIVRKKGRLLAPLSLLKEDGGKITLVRCGIVDAYLPESFFLKRSIEAPISARKNLQKVVELDMVRRTPFRSDTVFWATTSPHKSDNTLRIDQWIAKRSDIVALQGRAAKSGLRIRKVFIQNKPLQRPIADMSSTVAPNAKQWRLLNGLLAIAVIVLGAMVFLFPAWQASVERTRLENIIAENRNSAISLRKEVEVLRSRQIERAAFLDIIYQRARLSHTLRNFTVALPDNSWISDFRFSPKRLVVSGEVSGSAAQLVLAMGQRKEFSNPRLTGPIARASNGAERFELTLDLARQK